MFWNTLTLANQLQNLRREMDQLMAAFGPAATRWPFQIGAYPALNVWDVGDALMVEAEVPGVPKENLEISAIGDELTIKGRRPPLEGRNLPYHRQERGTGEFTRVITLPADVDADKVEAVVRDGVLSIRLPKAEHAKPRKIAVKLA